MKEPKTEQVTESIVGVSVQTGTGLSTNWAVYCDVVNSRVSEPFYYVLGAQGNYVIYAAYENGEHSVIVQNMFDKSAYYKAYLLEDASPVSADLVTGGQLVGQGCMIVTYLTGKDYKETDIAINFP